MMINTMRVGSLALLMAASTIQSVEAGTCRDCGVVGAKMKLQIAALVLLSASPAFAAEATFRGLRETCAYEGERSQECPNVDNPDRPAVCCPGLVCSGPRCMQPDACAVEGEKAIECGIGQVNRPWECCPGLTCDGAFCAKGESAQNLSTLDDSTARQHSELLVYIEPNLKNGKCLKAAGEGEMVKLVTCDESKANQQWIMDDVDGSQLRSKANPNLCIAMSLLVKECKDSSESSAEKQMWQYVSDRPPSKGWGLLRNKFSGLCMNPIHSDMVGSCSPADEDEVRWTLRNVDDDDNDDDDDDDDEEKPEEEPTVCIQDVKECWDGSFVGRNPKKNCAFTPCPEERPDKTAPTVYQIDKFGEGDYCLTAGFFGVKGKLKIKPCDETNVKAQWILDDDTKTIRPAAKPHLCVEVGRIVNGKSLRLNTCRDTRKKKQQWHWRLNGFGGSDPIRSDLRRDMCIYHTSSGTVKLGFAATHCVLPMSKMQWAFHEIDVIPDIEEPEEPTPEEPEEPEPHTEKTLKDCSWQKIESPEPGKGKKFGMHAMVNGDAMVVSDFDHPVEDIYVYKRNSNGEFKFDQKLDTDDRKPGDQFQYADTAQHGKYIAVSAKSADSDGMEDNGAVFMFEMGDDGRYKQVAYLKGQEEGDMFGNNIALVGDTLLVGARRANKDRGEVYAFRRNDSGDWERYGPKLVPSDVQKDDMFGRRINFRGVTAVIASLNRSGVYVFEDEKKIGFSEMQKLVPNDPGDIDSFGFKVDVDQFSKPPTIVVGAKRRNGKGVVYVYIRTPEGTWEQSAKVKPGKYKADYFFGADVAIEGDTMLVNALTENGSGLVYVFERQNTEWKQQLILSLAPVNPSREDGFGDSLDIHKNTAVLGAPAENDNTGSVYVVDLCYQ